MKLSPVTLRILARPASLGDTVDQAAMSSLGGKCQFNKFLSNLLGRITLAQKFMRSQNISHNWGEKKSS